jgi:uncharacterized protein (DUF1697 family)
MKERAPAAPRGRGGRYLALLRGINVGGKNLVRMAALKACLEDNGLQDVVTYIQSGNVLFRSSEPAAALTRRIEGIVEETFGCRASVLLRTRAQMRAIVDDAPRGFGAQPGQYRYDVIFLIPPLAPAAALAGLPGKPGVDEAHAGPGALYTSRLISRARQSRLNRLVSMPMYRNMTIRNWNTTTTLLRMMEEAASA